MMNQATIAPTITPTISTCRPARPERTSLLARLSCLAHERRTRVEKRDEGLSTARAGHVSQLEALRDRQAEVTLRSLRA
jgi:hypothetical protein